MYDPFNDSVALLGLGIRTRLELHAAVINGFPVTSAFKLSQMFPGLRIEVAKLVQEC